MVLCISRIHDFLFLSQIELKTFSKLRLSSSFKRLICSLFAMLTMSSMTDHFDNDFSTASKKILRHLAGLARQMDDLFNALYDFHGMFVHGGCSTLIYQQVFIRSMAPIHIKKTKCYREQQIMDSNHSH